VQPEPHRRKPLVVDRDRRQSLQGMPEVIAEEAHQATQERGRVGRHDRRAVEASKQPARHREGIRAGRRCIDDRDRIRGQIGPPSVPSGPGALQQRKAGQVAECLRGIDRPEVRDPIGQSPQPHGRQR
jgi:hypothetical protein